jgi:phosphatidylglycerophosphate synthase
MRLRFNMSALSPRLRAADLVTAFRAALVVALGTLLGGGAPSRTMAWGAVVLATVTAVFDGLDGWLARRSGTTTAFGARFDMETDAALILVLSLLAWRWDKAGAWVLLSGLMRYLFVGARFVLPWMGGSLTPTLRGKTVAVVQMVGLIIVIGPVVPDWLSAPVAALALAILSGSFAIDVRRLWRARDAGAT